jgi:hypothetical protein
MAQSEDRYKILKVHAFAPHGQLDRGAEKELNALAAEGYRVVAATGWTVILERTAIEARDVADNSAR